MMACDLCKLNFSSQKELQEHSWSLLHHRRIFREQGRTAIHHCSLCDEDIDSFPLYTKHINSDKHRNLLTKYQQLHTSNDQEPSYNTQSQNDPSRGTNLRKSEEAFTKYRTSESPSKGQSNSKMYSNKNREGVLLRSRYHYRAPNVHPENANPSKDYISETFSNIYPRNCDKPHQRNSEFKQQRLTRRTANTPKCDKDIKSLMDKEINFPMFYSSANAPNTYTFTCNNSSFDSDISYNSNGTTHSSDPSLSIPKSNSSSKIVAAKTRTLPLSSCTVSMTTAQSKRKQSTANPKQAPVKDKRKKTSVQSDLSGDNDTSEVLSSFKELCEKNFSKENSALSLLTKFTSSSDDDLPVFVSKKKVPNVVTSNIGISIGNNSSSGIVNLDTASKNNNIESTSTQVNSESHFEVKTRSSVRNSLRTHSQTTPDRMDEKSTHKNHTEKPSSAKTKVKTSVKVVETIRVTKGSDIQKSDSHESNNPFVSTESSKKPVQNSNSKNCESTGSKTPVENDNDNEGTLTSNMKSLLKQVTPFEVTVSKLPRRGENKFTGSVEKPGPETKAVEKDSNVENIESDCQDVSTSASGSEENIPVSMDILENAEHHCEFKKANATICDKATTEKFCEYHQRVMKAVKMYVSTKVAGTQSEVKDAVSLIQSPDNSLAAPSENPSLFTLTATENPTKSTYNTNNTEEENIVVDKDNRVIQRKRLLSDTTSDHDVESSTEVYTNSIDFSRFKRVRTDGQRRRSNSSCYSSDNSESTAASGITLRRFKYVNNPSSSHHELHMSNLPPTVRKLIEKKSKMTKSDARRKSISESECELPVVTPTGDGDVDSNAEYTREVTNTAVADTSNKVLAASSDLLASVTVNSESIALFSIKAPVISKPSSLATIATEEISIPIPPAPPPSTTTATLPPTTKQYSAVKTAHVSSSTTTNEQPSSDSNAIVFTTPIPIVKELSSTPTNEGVIKTPQGNINTTLPNLDISNISKNITAEGNNRRDRSTHKNSSSTTTQSEDFASPTSILSNVNLFQHQTEGIGRELGILPVKNVDEILTQPKQHAGSSSSRERGTSNTPDRFLLNTRNLSPMTSHLNEEEENPIRSKVCSDNENRRTVQEREKTKSKRKRKEYEGITGIQKQLTYLHAEENKLLNKLANANSMLDGLKKTMASVQDTIRSYTDRICKISEKKNKLLSKMSTTANQSLDFDDPTHYARPTSSAISASNSEGNSVSVTSDGGNNTSQYITPPRSPLLLPQRCPASEDPSKSQQHTLVQKTSVAEKCKSAKVISKLGNVVTCVKVHNRHVFVACGKPRFNVFVKNMSGNHVPHQLKSLKNAVEVMEVFELSDGRKFLCTASSKSNIMFYTFGDWRHAGRCDLHCGQLSTVHFSFERLFVSSTDGIVKSIQSTEQNWEKYEYSTFFKITGKKRSVTGICSTVSKNQKLIYAATRRGVIFVSAIENHTVRQFDISESFKKVSASSFISIQIQEETLYSVIGKARLLTLHSLDGIHIKTVQLNNSYLLIFANYFKFRENVILAADKDSQSCVFLNDIKKSVDKELYACKRRQKICCLDTDLKEVVLATACGDVILFDLNITSCQ